jgi:hypothetical protein
MASAVAILRFDVLVVDGLKAKEAVWHGRYLEDRCRETGIFSRLARPAPGGM